MISYEPGDVALVRFPFTDLSSTKKRPVVVVSPGRFSARYGDIVVLALTSSPQESELLKLEDWREAGLLKPTWIKPVLGTLALQVLERRLGSLSTRDRARVTSVLRTMIIHEFLSS